jgi:hypothetical protein
MNADLLFSFRPPIAARSLQLLHIGLKFVFIGKRSPHKVVNWCWRKRVGGQI